MAISGLDTIIDAVKKGVPDVFVKRRLNFITIHYLYIGGMTFFWSGIFYAMGAGVRYIDSLFFTSGASTQSGLNTINCNQLNTGQQVILYMLAMFCNPIAINTSVVFVRLYWFEKRFKDVVREARQLRRTRSRSKGPRAYSFRSDDTENRFPDTSVRGRAIQLLRNTGHKAENFVVRNHNDAAAAAADEKEKQVDSSDTSQDQRSEPVQRPRRRSSGQSYDEVRLPQQMGPEQHIRFLENQRNPKDTTTLRIPSPREFDRGGRVQSIDESQENFRRQDTGLNEKDKAGDDTEAVGEAPRVGAHITFNTPEVPSHHRQAQRAATMPRIDTGKASTMDPTTYDEEAGSRGRSRTRRGSGIFSRTNTGKTLEAAPYLSWQPTVARNSFFVNLTEEQREELGGIEYRALKTLALILLGYFFLFHIFGIVCLTAWIYPSSYASIVTNDGQGRAWWGVFTAASSFNDLGFTLTPDSMISFDNAVFPLLLMSFLIIIGNTGFPCMLRFVIWALSKLVPFGGGLWEELQFLLDHPRRCFTLLFPRAATWWLFAILVILNGLDLIFFIVLDLDDETVTSLSPGIRVLVGLFQAASTRTAGFAAVNIAALHPAIQVSYLIMMYISVFPIAISMRRTNVYEEKSLGIYAGAEEEEGDGNKQPSYVGAHLRKQLSFDLWYIFLGLFIICVVEGSQLENNSDYAFTIFAVLFEIVSAYGTVGLSLGYPTTDASFSSQFHTLSKLVIVAMQIRGRHRGLPYELDRAILLPSESLHAKEAQEGEKMLQRRRTSMSQFVSREQIAHVPQIEVDGAYPSERSYKTSHSNESKNSANDYGKEDDAEGTRQRRVTSNTSNKSEVFSVGSSNSQRKPSLLSRGLGNAMHRIAGSPTSIREEDLKRGF